MMKKFSLMFATAAIVAGGMLTASCSDNDNESAKEVVVKEIVLDDAKTIQLTSNVDTKFTIGNVSKTGKEVEFEVDGNTATIKAEVDGYVPQEATIDFSKNQDASAILFDMMKKSTNLVAQEDAKGHSVINDAANQKATGVVSAIEVPADVVITGNTTDPFAITTFVPAPDVIDLDDVQKNVEVTVPVLAFDCDPDGALFNKPVTISGVIPGIAGFDIAVPGAKNLVREGDKISFTVDHFSYVEVAVRAEIRGAQVSSKIFLNTTREVKNGINRLSYTVPAGFVGAGQGLSKIWKAFGTSLFGSPKLVVKKSLQLNVSGNGKVRLVGEQVVKNVEFVSGSETATIDVMGEESITATGTATDDVHSNGETNAH